VLASLEVGRTYRAYRGTPVLAGRVPQALLDVLAGLLRAVLARYRGHPYRECPSDSPQAPTARLPVDEQSGQEHAEDAAATGYRGPDPDASSMVGSA
jgi:hypothetical protein